MLQAEMADQRERRISSLSWGKWRRTEAGTVARGTCKEAGSRSALPLPLVAVSRVLADRSGREVGAGRLCFEYKPATFTFLTPFH